MHLVGFTIDIEIEIHALRPHSCVTRLQSSRQYLFDICLLQYVQSLTPDDGRNDRPKHVECYSNKIN